MWTWDIGIAAMFVLAITGLVVTARSRTSTLSRRTTRRAEDMYDEYSDSPGNQRRFARRRGGSWREDR